MRSPSTTVRQNWLESPGNKQPDAVITDCNMPEMSGCALSRSINEHYPSVTVFGMTADARESVRDEARGKQACATVSSSRSRWLLENLLALWPSGKSPVASPYSHHAPPSTAGR